MMLFIPKNYIPEIERERERVQGGGGKERERDKIFFNKEVF